MTRDVGATVAIFLVRDGVTVIGIPDIAPETLLQVSQTVFPRETRILLI